MSLIILSGTSTLLIFVRARAANAFLLSDDTISHLSFHIGFQLSIRHLVFFATGIPHTLIISSPSTNVSNLAVGSIFSMIVMSSS